MSEQTFGPDPSPFGPETAPDHDEPSFPGNAEDQDKPEPDTKPGRGGFGDPLDE